MTDRPISIYVGERLGDYNFGPDHPFGPLRQEAFLTRFRQLGLERQCRLVAPVMAARADIACFHDAEYVDAVMRASERGSGFLDDGDTPAFRGVFEAAARVVGTVLHALGEVMAGASSRAFVPIAGMHHAQPDAAAGFCVFNDCAIAIATLRQRYGLRRIAYVDIDAHHGDGVFYAFEHDPDVAIADIHEDGRFLYPGTGTADESGRGPATGTKLNIPMLPRANDRMFFEVWQEAEAFIDDARPEFILFQSGADSLGGDPIGHLGFTSDAHRHATLGLCALADRHCQGRLLAMGGGGYDMTNIAAAWCAVVKAMLEATRR